MKRNIVIAVVTAAVLAGGGTVTALAVSGDDDRDGGTASAGDRRDDDRRGDVDDDGDRRGDGHDDRRGDDDGAGRGEPSTGGDVGAADAVAAALRHTPGTVVSAELDHDDDRDGGRDGRAVWEVDVLSGDGAWRTLRIDPSTGRVTGDRAEDEDDAAEARAALKGAGVSAGEAAKAVSGKGTVTSVDLDDDRDAAWEVERRGGDEWRVDLRSGGVTPDRSDDD